MIYYDVLELVVLDVTLVIHISELLLMQTTYFFYIRVLTLHVQCLMSQRNTPTEFNIQFNPSKTKLVHFWTGVEM